MSMSVAMSDTPALSWSQKLSAFAELTKPRIAVLVLATVAAAASVATWGQPDPIVLVHAMFGTLLVACSAGAANQLWERDLDQLMPRTAQRPLVTRRLSTVDAVVFTMLNLVCGLAWLLVFVNLTTCLLTAGVWVLYVGVYTPLKTISSWNTAVGAIPGAMPVLIGWSAMEGPCDLRMASFFLTLFLWQFPHFMAIAWIYRQQYERAGYRMLPSVDKSGRMAGIQAIATAVALIPTSILPAWNVPGWGASAYAVAALVLGVAQLMFAIRFAQRSDNVSARYLLLASLVYLPLLLICLVLLPGA